ncbi:MAG: hypothetical protein CM1200mP18_00020 [Gammaproteobacteria bacterium]|nr:MAG: hypothetical protein CM1200mP18_00020 [Gammaproteobacteria bacterium]
MSKTTSFFTDYLPQKLSAHPDLAGKVTKFFNLKLATWDRGMSI